MAKARITVSVTDTEVFREALRRLAAVQALVDHAKKADRMTVYVGDLERALGLRDEPARTRTGSNE